MTDHSKPANDIDLPKTPSGKWGRANHWVSLAANVGVVIGLIILIFEVRQNAALTTISLESERSQAHSIIELRLSDPEVAEIWMKVIHGEEEMNDIDLRVVDGIFASVTLLWDRLLIMKSANLADSKRIERNIKNTAPFYFGSPFGKRWWNENSVGYKGTDLYDIADPIIQNIEDDFLKQYYNRLRSSDAKTNTPDLIEEIKTAE